MGQSWVWFLTSLKPAHPQHFSSGLAWATFSQEKENQVCGRHIFNPMLGQRQVVPFRNYVVCDLVFKKKEVTSEPSMCTFFFVIFPKQYPIHISKLYIGLVNLRIKEDKHSSYMQYSSILYKVCTPSNFGVFGRLWSCCPWKWRIP